MAYIHFQELFFLYNNERYKILKGEIAKDKGKMGEVLKNELVVACGKDESIKILKIQREGKKPQKIKEFILGSKIKKGSNLNNA